MKILLSGANGMLGSSLTELIARRGWKCTALSRAVLDFSRPDSFVDALSGHDIFIHSAANTNVEGCETDIASCYRDNTLLTEMLSHAADQCGVRMVYVSSTGVYGDHGTRPYHEFDSALPTTHHHRSKLLGEQAVLRRPDSLVVRTGWLFGGLIENPKNFVARRIEEALACTTEIYSNDTQRGCPSYVDDVAKRLLLLVAERHSGLFNCVNDGDASRYEYVAHIVKTFGLDIPVKPASAQVFSRKAKVSNNEMAINLKQEIVGLAPMQSWQSALNEYINAKRNDFTLKSNGS